MVHIEFMGPPGAGKSTIKERLAGMLGQEGKQCFTLEQALIASLRRKCDDRMFRCMLRLFPDCCMGKKISALYQRSKSRIAAQNRFLAANGPAFGAFLESNQFKCMTSGERTWVVGKFLKLASMFQTIKEQIDENARVVLDEGFLQKTVSLFVLPERIGNSSGRQSMFRYLNSIPIPNVSILVQADIEVCQARMESRARRLPLRLQKSDTHTISAFLLECQVHFNEIAEWLEKHRRIVVRVLNDGGVDDSTEKIRRAVQACS